MPPAIQLIGVTRTLPSGGKALTILDHVDLVVEPGEFLAILGPSGSGKSTLLSLLAGLDRPSSGSIRIAGVAIESLSEDRLAVLRRTKIGFIFQSFQLLANLTARENVMLPLELLGLPDARRRAGELLESVGLAERTHHYPTQLSGGEQQRVAIARAFATKPPILLADEPTGNLDSVNGTRVMDLLLNMRKFTQTTMVLVTHDPGVAKLAESRIFLRDGRVERYEPRDTTQRPTAPATALDLQAQP